MKSHSKKYRKVTPKIKLEFIKLYSKQGKSITEIGKKYNVNYKTVYYHLVKAGTIIVNSKDRKYKERDRKIVAAYISGKKIAQIAYEFKLLDGAISTLLVKRGVYDFSRIEEDDKTLSKEDKRKLDLLKLQIEKMNPGKNYEDYIK